MGHRRKAILAAILVLVLAAVAVVTTVALRRAETAPYGARLDVDPRSRVALEVADASSDLTARERRLLAHITAEPTATWITGPTRLVTAATRAAVRGASARDGVATVVAYNIPGRDCGSESASSERVDAADYRAWLRAFVAGLGDERAIVILEPDALAQMGCLDDTQKTERLALLRYGVSRIAAQGSWVYLDAGHRGWLEPAEAADRLQKAGIARATGFSLNVSNFGSTASEVAYGDAISSRVDSAPHFVVDTSRNGVQPADGQWCNPPGRGLGTPPTTRTSSALVDAYLWIKTPGASDGACNGGPSAGTWWTDYALTLAKNRQRS
jgi:endoglucanase